MLILYHYTTEDAAKSIKDSKVIYKSTRSRRDAIHGDGVYLTSISPDKSKSVIIRNNWDDGKNVIKKQIFRYYLCKSSYRFTLSSKFVRNWFVLCRHIKNIGKCQKFAKYHLEEVRIQFLFGRAKNSKFNKNAANNSKSD